MSKSNGFLQLRRGIWEHVRDGRMSTTEALAFIYICSEADTRTGIWKGSAKSLSGELGIPERTARDVLEKMEHGYYIRRFTVPGSHSCYPILVHRFSITQGEHYGEQLNALASTSPADLAYFPREQSVEQDGEYGVEHGAAQRRIEKEKREKPPRPSALEDGFESFWKTFPRKVAKKAAARAWAKVPESERAQVIAAVGRFKLTEQWQKDGGQFIPHPSTFLNGRRWEDELPTPSSQTAIGKSGRVPHIPTAADCRPEH